MKTRSIQPSPVAAASDSAVFHSHNLYIIIIWKMNWCCRNTWMLDVLVPSFRATCWWHHHLYIPILVPSPFLVLSLTCSSTTISHDACRWWRCYQFLFDMGKCCSFTRILQRPTRFVGWICLLEIIRNDGHHSRLQNKGHRVIKRDDLSKHGNQIINWRKRMPRKESHFRLQ